MATKRKLATNKSPKTNKSAKNTIPAELHDEAVEYFVENSLANEHSRKADKARKSLYGGMSKIGLKEFHTIANIDGVAVNLHAEIKSGVREAADPVALYDLVKKGRITEEEFLSVISATKTAVEAKLGKSIFAQVAVAVPTTENVSVKPLR